MSPVEIRRRNLIARFPYTSATGLVFDEGSYIETLDQAAAHVDLPAFRARQRSARAHGRYLGIGFATFSERTGYGSPAFAARGMEITPGWETVEIVMDPSGRVEARIGASPHGQGLRTTLAQLIADEVGIAPHQVRVVARRHRSHALRLGHVRQPLAGDFRRRRAAGGAENPAKAPCHRRSCSGGRARRHRAGGRAAPKCRAPIARLTIAALARAAYHGTHRFDGDVAPGLSESAQYDPPGTFSNACHVAIVEVDAETGRVGIEKFLAVEDAGRIINPLIADGQVHGGIAQGIGNALFEEIVYDRLGNIHTATLADYLPPTCGEIPPIELHHIESPAASSVTGAKGLGEGGAIGAPAAILNAVNDALSPFSVSIDEIPATPQRIRAALRAAGVRDQESGIGDRQYRKPDA